MANSLRVAPCQLQNRIEVPRTTEHLPRSSKSAVSSVCVITLDPLLSLPGSGGASRQVLSLRKWRVRVCKTASQDDG